jgi:ornithine racemase
VHYPCLKINLSKVENNIRIINGRCALRGISAVGVSKCFFGDRQIAEVFKKNGIKIFGDSRILNLLKLRKHFGPAQELYMLRTPMITEVKELVGYAAQA